MLRFKLYWIGELLCPPAGRQRPAAAVGALYLRHHLEAGEAGVRHHGQPEHVHVPRDRDRGRVLCCQLGRRVTAWGAADENRSGLSRLPAYLPVFIDL